MQTTMNNQNSAQDNNGLSQLINIDVIFDIYGEDGEDVVSCALGAFFSEAQVYMSQISAAVRQHDAIEAERLFQSLYTMASMVGARSFAHLASELEILLPDSVEFFSKYQQFCTLWQKLVIELENFLG